MSGPGAQLSGPGAQLSGSGAQLSAILVCIRHICAPVHVREILQQYTYESDQGLVAAGYSSVYYIYIIGILVPLGASPSKSTKLSLLAVVRQLCGRTNK